MSQNVFVESKLELECFLSKENREEELDLENFCPKKQKIERELST